VAASLKSLGERIRDLRKARGWSQERFADVCGVHRTYMGHLERGEKNVSFNTLVRLADALGITLPELLAENGSRSGKKKAPRPAIRRLDSLTRVIRELNQRRIALEETAGALKAVTEVLRTRQKRSE
jgi:transcriptional regulator with XRE-family HTH domain